MAIYFSRCDARRVVRVVGRANQCLPLTTTCATTVHTDSLLFVAPHPPTTPSDHRRGLSRAPIDHTIDWATLDAAKLASANLDLRWRCGDGDSGRRVGRTRGCPGRGCRAYRKAQNTRETGTRNGLHLSRASFFHREIASRWEKSCPKSPRCS